MAENGRPLADRLLDGARTLGRFWREAKCATGAWSVKRTADGKDFEPCACEPKARFCKAKMQWLKLAAEEPREIVEGGFGLALTMRGFEWDATGCTLHWELEGVGTVKVGPKGGTNMALLRELSADPSSALAVLKVMMKFPNSKMEFDTAEGAGAKGELDVTDLVRKGLVQVAPAGKAGDGGRPASGAVV